MRPILVFGFLMLMYVGDTVAQTYPVKWNELVNVTDNNGVLTKVTPAMVWDAGANAYNVLPAGQDGWVEFTVHDLASLTIVGFSVSDLDFNYTSTLYSWYIRWDGGWYEESGGNGTIATCQVGDVFRLSREGDFIKYYQNGIIRRAVRIYANQAMKVKSLVAQGANPAVQASFDVKLVLSKTISPVTLNGTGGGVQVIASGGNPPYTYHWSSGENTAAISNKDLGDYTVEVRDAANHSVSAKYHVGYPTQIIYVRNNASGLADGSTWENAYPDLQQAIIASAGIMTHKEIWVARGEYLPTAIIDRTASFILPPNTFIYGGFIGGEKSLDQRNWSNNRTVLSGDLGILFNKSDNSYHVITANNIDENSGLDGFIITHGNATYVPGPSYNSSGGGAFIMATSVDTSPQIRNCEFVDNQSSNFGGGIVNISNGANISTQISNCFFNGNTSVIGGGAMNYQISGSNSPIYVNCSFSSNTANSNGGGIANFQSTASVINSTFCMNRGVSGAGAIYNDHADVTIKNSILWKNFKGNFQTNLDYNQIRNFLNNPIVQNNIIQNGYGDEKDNNIDVDPLFVREPSFIGKFPRTSVVPVGTTESKYENTIRSSGPLMSGHWVYYSYFDRVYSKLYSIGQNIQIHDFNNTINGLPTSHVYSGAEWTKIQRLENSIYTEGNKIFMATSQHGIVSFNRQNSAMETIDPIADEGIAHSMTTVEDLLIDDDNNLLYAPVFYQPGSVFYGLLELNLTTNARRWINQTSTPVSMPVVNNIGPGGFYDGYKMYLDKQDNILYFSTGNGLWWWNRSTNDTGIYTTSGGMPLLTGNPNLPSNLTTHILIDHNENKFYIGTHEGLFVWDRNTNTSKVYNTQNSLMITNNVNAIAQNEDEHLLYVPCELNGGLFVLNTITDEQKILVQDYGNETNPQLIGTEIESAYFDKVAKKLYVSTDLPSGGVWIKDYANLIPDYGDFRLQGNSIAIDLGDPNYFPASITTTDVGGLDRFINYTSINGDNSLDLGAYEKAHECIQPSLDFQYEKINGQYVFTPILDRFEGACNISYTWDFGDGTSSTLANPIHTYELGNFTAKLKVAYKCGVCVQSEIQAEQTFLVENVLCGKLYYDKIGGISLGTADFANGYKLSVEGKVIMEGGRILLNSRWPDYVFDPNYKLLSLSNLKKYVNGAHHLPGIPAAEFIKKQGVDLGEMSVILLEKTEELTLYLLKLDERLRKLEEEEPCQK